MQHKDICDIAELISSVSATISTISEGVTDRSAGRALSFMAEMLDGAVEDLYQHSKREEAARNVTPNS